MMASPPLRLLRLPRGRQGLLRRDAATMTAAGGASLRAIAQEAGRRRHGVAVSYLAVRTALRRPADVPIVPRHREAADDGPRRPS